MKCTYCKNGAWYRPKNLDDHRRACEWCITEVAEDGEWVAVHETEWDWEVLQHEGRLVGTVSRSEGWITKKWISLGSFSRI